MDASKPHLVYVPGEGLCTETVIGRGVALIMALPNWNVSVRLQGDHTEAELAGFARVACESVAKMLPFQSAHLEALQRGLTVTRVMRPKEDIGEDVEQTAQEVRSGVQGVLKPVPDVPAAKVVLPGLTGKEKASKASTRASSSVDAEKAAALEAAAQEKGLAAAKRKRDQAEAKAQAAARPSKSPKPKVPEGTKPNVKKAGRTKAAAMNLGAAGGSGGASEEAQE